MKYSWSDYNSGTMNYVENWLDDDAIRQTGIDNGWQDFCEYWLNEEKTVYGGNYRCKAVFENEIPFDVIAIG